MTLICCHQKLVVLHKAKIWVSHDSRAKNVFMFSCKVWDCKLTVKFRWFFQFICIKCKTCFLSFFFLIISSFRALLQCSLSRKSEINEKIPGQFAPNCQVREQIFPDVFQVHANFENSWIWNWKLPSKPKSHLNRSKNKVYLFRGRKCFKAFWFFGLRLQDLQTLKQSSIVRKLFWFPLHPRYQKEAHVFLTVFQYQRLLCCVVLVGGSHPPGLSLNAQAVEIKGTFSFDSESKQNETVFKSIAIYKRVLLLQHGKSMQWRSQKWRAQQQFSLWKVRDVDFNWSTSGK
jgi:hypothetical protein